MYRGEELLNFTAKVYIVINNMPASADRCANYGNTATHKVQHLEICSWAAEHGVHSNSGDRQIVHLRFVIDGTGQHNIMRQLAIFEIVANASDNNKLPFRQLGRNPEDILYTFNIGFVPASHKQDNGFVVASSQP